MSQIPLQSPGASGGTLEAMIYCAPAQELDWRLEWIVRAQLPPRDAGPTGAPPKLTIAGLDLGVRSFRALGGRSYAYSTAPRPRREDGEVYEDYEREGVLEGPWGLGLVVVARLELGVRRALALEANVELELHLDGQPPRRERLALTLAIGPVVFIGDREADSPPSGHEAAQVAARFLDLSDYELRNDARHPRFWPRAE